MIGRKDGLRIDSQTSAITTGDTEVPLVVGYVMVVSYAGGGGFKTPPQGRACAMLCMLVVWMVVVWRCEE